MTLGDQIRAQAVEIDRLKKSVAAIRETRDAVLELIPPDTPTSSILKPDYHEKLASAARTIESLKSQQSRALQHFHDELANLRREVSDEIQRIIQSVDNLVAHSVASPFRPLGGLSFPFRPTDPLDGVIAGLTQIGGANVHDRGLAEVIASGCFDESRFPPKFVADLTAANAFVSANAPMQWVGYHFKQALLRFGHYALRSRFDGWVNSNNPKSWVIECSQDGENWVEVDRRMGNCDLNATDVTKVFTLESEAEGQYVRIRQVEPAHSGKNFLALSAFELFGKFVD
jgi:hypothetical protein